jgi:hypothetical protein
VTGSVDPENPGRVIDRDLQDRNALWQAGAEAIAINGSAHRHLDDPGRRRGDPGRLQPVTRPVPAVGDRGPTASTQRLAESATGKRFKRFV